MMMDGFLNQIIQDQFKADNQQAKLEKNAYLQIKSDQYPKWDIIDLKSEKLNPCVDFEFITKKDFDSCFEENETNIVIGLFLDGELIEEKVL